MNTQKIGYARASTAEQNLERQLDLLKNYGVDYIFQEKMSDTKRDRPLFGDGDSVFKVHRHNSFGTHSKRF